MDERGQQAIDWASAALGQRPDAVEAIGSDASHRRYFRLSLDKASFIVMDAPPEKEAVDAFVDVQHRLSTVHLNVPNILGINEASGFLLLSDLGKVSYLSVLSKDNANDLFIDAQTALITIQTEANSAGLKPYDAAHLLRELNLFPDWFLVRHWGVVPNDEELDEWDHLCALLIRWALDQPQVFCHRDYMPRNLMVSSPNPGILDFQDAVMGPVSYDITSLYLDAFISWPREQVHEWLEQYRQAALVAGLALPQEPTLWRKMCELMSVQRHLKVIGIFARIAYRDGKPRYLQDVPRFFDYIKATVSSYPELALWSSLLERWSARASRQDELRQ